MKDNKYFISKLSDYHKRRRKRIYAENGPVVGHIGIHSFWHDILLHFIKLLRIFRGQKIYTVGDKRKKTNNPRIYAITHIGGNDVEISFEAIKEPAYILLGNPRELYCNFDGVMLAMNGMICMEMDDKQDRRIARERCEELLRKGGSLIIYPEGAWNLSDNLLVMPLYVGCLEMAVACNAEIIPIALEVYDDIFYVNIGENILASEIDLSNKARAADKLRDRMATLKWEIYEKVGLQQRRGIPENYHEFFVKRIILAKNTSFNEQDVEDTKFRPKGIINPEEAFAFMDKLIPCKENAFLFRK